MRKPFVKKSASLTAIFLLLGMLLAMFSPFAGSVAQAKGDKVSIAADKERVQIQGNEPTAAQRGKLVAHTDANTQINFTVSLKPRNAEMLDALLAAQQDPNSKLYHQYITPEEFAKSFGADPQDVAKVVDFLQKSGLVIENVNLERTLIKVSGAAGNVETAFGTRLNNYANAKGETYFAHESNPVVPAAINGLVQHVTLNNEAHWHPSGLTMQTKAQPHLGSGPGGGYTPSELRAAYDVNPLLSAGYDGTGQKVALFELDGYVQTNITQYVNNYGLGSPTPTKVLVDGYNGAAGQGQVEVELDIEVVMALAPKAPIIVYEGPNTDAGVLDTYQRIATDNTAKVVSSSWGLCELDSSTSSMNSLHTVFQQMASQGQSIYSAAGDDGAYDCRRNGTANSSKLAVDSPSNDPYVTAVGGTYLTLSGGAYGSERVWGTTSNSSGGGGGVSTVFTKPSYQTGTGTTSFTGRGVPDISADADPASGYSIYSQSQWTTVGGTSAAAPLWAGITALNNQYALANGKTVLGHANPTLYRLYNNAQTYAPFHDITSGTNLYYSAVAGYDLASGIGTPDTYNLVRDINGGSTGGGGGTTPTQLISNGGFESGSTSWTQASSGGYSVVDSSTSSLHHAGSASAWLCGYDNCSDSIYQSISIPSTATSVSLTFYVYVSTKETGTTAYDKFTAKIRNSSGTVLATPTSLSNASGSGWKQYTVNLTSYKGQTVQVYFSATTDSSLTTSFFLDDVSVISQ